jgi:catechol 2,3-dioxygenase-like lactoylglutathione lyase family enzyme
VPVAIDHVVVAVNDLAATIQDYERLGFTVTIGGEHAHRGSHNALVTFQDGSYIELIAFRHEPPVKDNTWWDLLQIGEGLVDVAVISEDLPREIAALAEAGFAIAGPMQGGRHLPDGTRIDWRVARLDVQGHDRYPFLIDDLTSRDQRVPQGETSRHANGVTGTARVTIGVSSLASATPRFEAIFGEGDGPRFTVGDQAIDLVDPDTAPPELAAPLASHGPGPLEIGLRRPDRQDRDAAALPLDLTHNARFVII